ncbi:MAG: putative response regulator/GGDEF domain transcriptional regulator [Sphingomonas bacterium]|uniref:sensor domain-containing diguanylate cyclase n=1 Tax=Sphingomonas bacterium TaxID=1895847 RepID=UPI0026393AF4|nr:sensor domain-containing diguanylate cyclase [Sphingomonas bacterium]MDB5707538.1 putative response regulator/GGDEF domain transcriptional regulator [Sphingomonas bacterium]
MRISTITNWAYGVTVVLTAISGVAFIQSGRAASDERVAVEQHLTLDDFGEELALAAEKRSDEARLYAMRGSARHLAAFRQDDRETHARERVILKLRSLDLAPAELAALKQAESNLDELDAIEVAAVAKVEVGDVESARQMLFGPDHERAQTAVLEPVTRFRALVAARTGSALNDARAQSDHDGDVAKAMLGITAALFLAVLYFVLRRRVAVPLTRMTGIVARLARQDYSVEVPLDRRRDEIGDMTNAIHIFRDNGLERDRLEAERAADQRAKDTILQMMHRLQATETQEELAEVVACFAPQTFPNLAGHLYVQNHTRTALTLASSWLDPVVDTASFAPTACWGLRRGRPHVSNREHVDISCPHIGDSAVPALCVPLTAQGDTVGLLYFEERAGVEAIGAASRLYLELMAENIGLALANLRLREQLTNLAIRDALTGLLNRRCLDETLNRRVHESRPDPIAGLMIDIDHFKHFNDEFGHEAGDMVMQQVAAIMLDVVGEAGQVYRFGGEEFTVLLPGGDEAAAMTMAERIRAQVAAAPLACRGRVLGHVSVSIGTAASPQDGPLASLVARADAALLVAKSGGRNLVIAASRTGTRTSAAA